MKEQHKKHYPFDETAAENVAQALEPLLETQDAASAYDPLGSYTGTPLDPEEKPVQDVDDL